jgi:hypothetical protein
MEKGLVATGTHPYRPLGRRTDTPGDKSGKSQPKVGCAQGLSKARASFTPTEVAAWDNDALGNCAVYGGRSRARRSTIPPGPPSGERSAPWIRPWSVTAQRAYLGAYFDQFRKGRLPSLLRQESPRRPEVKFVR